MAGRARKASESRTVRLSHATLQTTRDRNGDVTVVVAGVVKRTTRQKTSNRKERSR
jgi:hypothetical protein